MNSNFNLGCCLSHSRYTPIPHQHQSRTQDRWPKQEQEQWQQQQHAAASLGLAGAAAAVLLLLIAAIPVPAADAHVVIGAYNETCPQAEDVVFKEMTAIVAEKPHLAGAVLRLFSLDCFVDGCEGSILLDSTAGNTAEKDAPLNRGVRGYEVVDAIKAKLDAACPGVVSCADTLALAARDSIRLAKGPFIPLPTGRRDGNRSVAGDVALFSPAPDANITDIINLFVTRFNLTAKDVAVLSGAHTIGQARCSTVSPRLYNFAGHGGTSDPALDGNYTAILRGQCKPGDNKDNATLVDLDPTTPATFDADYYALVAGKRGLLSTDAALLRYPATSAYVERQARAASPDEFFADFAASFVAMSRLDVLTHHEGEIRKVCSKVNPPVAVVVPSPSSSSAAAAASRSYELAAVDLSLWLWAVALLVL